jgi:uncharacterized glyoxalase superfamily protein PhnB
VIDPRNKVISIRAFIPARDLDVSRRFYQDLGFQEIWGDDSACGMQIDDCGIILQKFYVKEHAENFMMALNVQDLDGWWRRIQALGLKEKYNLGTVKAPAMQPWGIRVLYICDPTGVLWHIAEYSRA